jgi:hypothetical protein
VTVTQSPLAGTVVGLGTHTITLTATDGVGNTTAATTTFTVEVGDFTFTVSLSPATASPGKTVKVIIDAHNTTSSRVDVSFLITYCSPCGNFTLDNLGPIPVNAGADRTANVPFHVPKTACPGLYTFKVEARIGGVLVGTSTAPLTVTAESVESGRKSRER